MEFNPKYLLPPMLTKRPGKWTSPPLAFKTVISKSGLGVYASSDALYKGALFGRDSLEVAEDLLYVRPKLVEQILLVLASFQGQEFYPQRDEEPGKILHEYRTRIVEGREIAGATLEVFNKYSFRWGGNNNTYLYFGSCDATPLFVRLLCLFCQAYGKDILLKEVNRRSGRRVSMLEVLDAALDWILRHLHYSQTGLVEYKRAKPTGLLNHVWKDSDEFYVHSDGQMANHESSIASVEVQALAYDALIYAAELLPSRAADFEIAAQKLQRRTIDLMWDDKTNYFAVGVDFSNEGILRPISTECANPANMLDSVFFDKLLASSQQEYVSAIVRKIMSDDFLTDAGIRSRSLAESDLVPFWDYHGSFVSWPKETYDIAKGLRKQGFPLLAKELENRLLNLVRAMRVYPEFVYIDRRGRVLGVSRSIHGHGEILLVEGPNQPERIQAWTVSAILAITSKPAKTKNSKHIKQQAWQEELEKDILRSIPHVPVLKSAKELSARYPAYPYQLKNNTNGQ
jgi:glycogen debranching enzyme